MRLKSFLCCTSLLVLLALPAIAEPLAPRGEVSVKGGTDRSLLTTEFWAPLAQQSDRVLYGDIRLMGDNDENREGNLGLGYRQIKNDAVIGVHGWIDRRRTQHNSTFHQLTFGVERLGHIVDARANVYIPINNGRNIITPNIGVTSPYLAGSGIYYDTNGSINETPQYGLDGELGYRIPVWQKHIDAIRVYGGGYYFFRDNTVEVPGARFRTEAQVNKIVSVGARVQYDKPRGTQGFLEATLKFPFSAKRLYQESGIRSRLDESPERDVDIVTDTKIDTGLFKPVINTITGSQQRILYVDNTKPDGGDGSYEKPFNSLKSAEAALQSHDILYVNRGDGTTRNMDQGIVIDKPNIQLSGSGSALTYNGTTLLTESISPIITNKQVPSSAEDVTVGSGILVTAGNTKISGVTLSGAAFNGIRAMITDEKSEYLTIQNVSVLGNASTGILVQTSGNAFINQVNLLDNTSRDNQSNGLGFDIRTGSTIQKLNITGNTASNNSDGIFFRVNGGNAKAVYINNNDNSSNRLNGVRVSIINNGLLEKMIISQNKAISNLNQGILIDADTGVLDDVSIIDSQITNNSANGIQIQSRVGSTINTANLSAVVASNNTGRGVNIFATGGTINRASLTDITASENTLHGVLVQATTSSSVIGNAELTRITANDNQSYGVFLYTNNGGTLNNAYVTQSTMNNNANGLYIQQTASGGAMNLVSASSNNTLNNTTNGIYVTRSNTGAAFNIDLGGGAFGSIGQNRSFGNTGKDLRLNYTGGGAVFAKNNWWGDATGLQAGRLTLSASTTVDSTAFLTADPRP